MTEYLNQIRNDYYGETNSFFDSTKIQRIEDCEQDWVDFIANGGMIYTLEGIYNGFQKMKDGRYCFFGYSNYGDLIYKVF